MVAGKFGQQHQPQRHQAQHGENDQKGANPRCWRHFAPRYYNAAILRNARGHCQPGGARRRVGVSAMNPDRFSAV